MSCRPFRTDELRADLGTIPVGENDAMARADEPDDGRGCFDGVFELFLRRRLLSAADERVSSNGNQNKL